MSHKFVFSVVSALALMTIVVSAQPPGQPANGGGLPSSQEPGELAKPVTIGTGGQSLQSTDLLPWAIIHSATARTHIYSAVGWV